MTVNRVELNKWIDRIQRLHGRTLGRCSAPKKMRGTRGLQKGKGKIARKEKELGVYGAWDASSLWCKLGRAVGGRWKGYGGSATIQFDSIMWRPCGSEGKGFHTCQHMGAHHARIHGTLLPLFLMAFLYDHSGRTLSFEIFEPIWIVTAPDSTMRCYDMCNVVSPTDVIEYKCYRSSYLTTWEFQWVLSPDMDDHSRRRMINLTCSKPDGVEVFRGAEGSHCDIEPESSFSFTLLRGVAYLVIFRLVSYR